MARLFIVLLAFLASLSAQALELKPFKDKEFAYPGIIGDASNPLDLTIDYQEMRDINGRDAVPELRVKPPWLSTSVRRQAKPLSIETPAGPVKAIATGSREGASFIVLFLHGKGGNRELGQNDLRFGGNFNRIRNLAVQNGGVYVTTDFTGFGDEAASQVSAVAQHFFAASPAARFVLACGSMGGFVCHRLANDPAIVPRLSGVLFMGSFPDGGFASSGPVKSGMPVFIGHGSNDKTSPLASMEGFAATLRANAGAANVMIHRFASGSHGTPIRMTDWRLVLNWMFSKGR
jgi:pimeloyl-ACP methyl ester carboxylesterase